eukprot:3567579-Amphidinium_carterae.1
MRRAGKGGNATGLMAIQVAAAIAAFMGEDSQTKATKTNVHLFVWAARAATEGKCEFNENEDRLCCMITEAIEH